MVHVFSAGVARHFGIHSAVVYQYLSYVAERNNWSYSISLRHLADKYPYMTHTTVNLAISKLLKGTKKHPALLKRDFDTHSGAGRYLVDKDQAYEAKAASQHRFSAEIAVEHGVVAALVYHNIGYWIRQNWRAAADAYAEGLKLSQYGSDYDLMTYDAMLKTQHKACHYTIPRFWQQEHLYTNLRTVARAFSELVSKGLLVKREGRSRLSSYTLDPYTMIDIVITQCNLGELVDSSDKAFHPMTKLSTQGQSFPPQGQSFPPQSTQPVDFEYGISESVADRSYEIEAPDLRSSNGNPSDNEAYHTSPLRGDGVKFTRSLCEARERDRKFSERLSIYERINSESAKSASTEEPPKLTYKMLKKYRMTAARRALAQDFFDFDFETPAVKAQHEKLVEVVGQRTVGHRYDTLPVKPCS